MAIDSNTYPKYKVIHYFETRDVIMENALTTGLFDDSLRQYIDPFCEMCISGKWQVDKNVGGGANWYWEFQRYLSSIHVDVKFKKA